MSYLEVLSGLACETIKEGEKDVLPELESIVLKPDFSELCLLASKAE